MPVYNSELYIKEAIDSILNQTFSDFELIIIDDASTDKSVEIIQSYTDSRIQLILKPKNSGYTNSLNYGLTIAKGEYIARMDSDDISLPTRFEKQVAFLEVNSDVVLCGTAFKHIHNDFYVSVPEQNDQIKVGMLQECKIGHPTVMMRTSFLKKHQLTYNTLMEPAEDYDLWTRMIHLGKFHNLQEPLLRYRVHENQVSSKRNLLQIQKALQIKSNLFFNLDKTPSSREVEAYKSVLFVSDKSMISDFLIFLKLKKKMICSNNDSNYFDKKLFNNFLSSIEESFMKYYFKKRLSYNFKIFADYVKIFNKTSYKLDINSFFKFILKCIIFYKVK